MKRVTLCLVVLNAVPLWSAGSGFALADPSDRTEPATILVGPPIWPPTEVPFNTYVEDVLPNEWPSAWHWPMEAYKAGAVAAKMYGWYRIEDPLTSSFDVYSDSRSQVYEPGSGQLPDALQTTTPAVVAVRSVGMQRADDGQLFLAEYWNGRCEVSSAVGARLRSSPSIRPDNTITTLTYGTRVYAIDSGENYADAHRWFEVAVDGVYPSTTTNVGYIAADLLRGLDIGGNTVESMQGRLTQYGTVYWANQGWEYQEILHYFYDGSTKTGGQNIDFFNVIAGGDTYWRGSTGNWSTDSNWTNGEPTSSVKAHINGGTATINKAAEECKRLVLGEHSDDTGTLEMTDGNLTVREWAHIGYGGTGEFLQSGGTNTILRTLSIGDQLGSQGTYQVRASGVLSANFEYVGQFGTGEFIQSGGTHTVSANLFVGLEPGAHGTYTLSGGELRVPSEAPGSGSEVIGSGGSGQFTHTGGTNTVNRHLVIGDESGSSGSYELSGGSLSAAAVYVGGSGSGVFNWTGGTLNASTINVNADGTMTVAQSWSYQGALNISGGSVNLGSNDLILDRGATASLTGGQLSVADEWLGHKGTAEFMHSGGTNNVADRLYLGYRRDSRGTYDLSGTAELSAKEQYIGEQGTGTFTQFGGTNSMTQWLYLGHLSGSTGTYNLSGGALSVPTVAVAPSGGGVFNWTGGMLNADTVQLWPGGTVSVGFDATFDGTLSFQEGTLITSASFSATGSIVIGKETVAMIVADGPAARVMLTGNGMVDGAVTKTGAGTLGVGSGTWLRGDLAISAGVANTGEDVLALATPGGPPRTITLGAMATLNASGHVNGFVVDTGGVKSPSTLNALGPITVGVLGDPDGYNYAGILNANTFEVVLLDDDKADVGIALLGGGGASLTGVKGIQLNPAGVGFGGFITGSGEIHGVVTAGTPGNPAMGFGGVAPGITVYGDVIGLWNQFDNTTVTGVLHAGFSPAHNPLGPGGRVWMVVFLIGGPRNGEVTFDPDKGVYVKTTGDHSQHLVYGVAEGEPPGPPTVLERLELKLDEDYPDFGWDDLAAGDEIVLIKTGPWQTVQFITLPFPHFETTLVGPGQVEYGPSFEGDLRSALDLMRPKLATGLDVTYTMNSDGLALHIIPEPGTLALLLSGGLVLFAYAWRRRRR